MSSGLSACLHKSVCTFCHSALGVNQAEMQLLACILCFAYPSNLAVGRRGSLQHETRSVRHVRVANGSVNNLGRKARMDYPEKQKLLKGATIP
eukprot:4486238-Amphidinium_carterae.1